MSFPHSMSGPAHGRRTGRRSLVLAAATVGCLLATAASASADTRVAIEPGNFGSGIEGGAVLTVRDQRDLFHDERILVRVTRLASGRWQVVDSEREAVAGENCRRESASVVTCEPRRLDGIYLEGTKFGDRLDNDTAVASRIEGRAGNDILDGGDAGDTMIGEAGNDRMSGQGGNDTVLYGAGASGPVVVTIDGLANDGTAAEDDNITTDTENVGGTPFPDTIVGSAAANVLTGGGGDDRIDGLAGNDTLKDGGSPSGADDLNGGDGTDTVTYLGRTAGVTVLLNGLPDDGNSVDDDAAGGGAAPGDNVRNVETVIGSDRPDFIRGDDGPNTIDGNGGTDSIQALGGNDAITGDADRDVIEGGAGDDTIDGHQASGVDIVEDVLLGGDGNDLLLGRAGDDKLHGEAGNDRLEGGDGNDDLDGGLDGDSLQGDSGFDTVNYSDRRLPVNATLNEVNGDDGDATDGPPGGRDTLRFVEHLITGDADDFIKGSPVGETLEPRGGVDAVLAAGGGDTLITNDGVADVISCGQDGVQPEPRDFLSADLADILDPDNQRRLSECELFEAAAVGQLPNVKILTERLRITSNRRARIKLHCPATVNTGGCAGRLTLTHPGDGKQLATRRYRLAKGARKVVVFRLSLQDLRWLKRSRKALATAVETDPTGRPKTTRALLRVQVRR